MTRELRFMRPLQRQSLSPCQPFNLSCAPLWWDAAAHQRSNTARGRVTCSIPSILTTPSATSTNHVAVPPGGKSPEPIWIFDPSDEFLIYAPRKGLAPPSFDSFYKAFPCPRGAPAARKYYCCINYYLNFNYIRSWSVGPAIFNLSQPLVFTSDTFSQHLWPFFLRHAQRPGLNRACFWWCKSRPI